MPATAAYTVSAAIKSSSLRPTIPSYRNGGKGEITPEQARVHPNKNYITRALGIVPQIHLDYIEAPFEQGDILLMCSDGLSNYLTPAELVRLSLEMKGKRLQTRWSKARKGWAAATTLRLPSLPFKDGSEEKWISIQEKIGWAL